MRKILIGMSCGTVAGIIDIVPMVLQKLTWDANFSAFTMWVVIGFFLSVVNLKINSIMKGIIFSFLVLLPSAILIGWNEPVSLLPIFFMTLILGGLLGLIIDKLTKNEK
ncbi:hypothetical protein COY32_00865 [candidate division WWE3 bacterium CG_4_10_14_0_2_um_filter_41_14]|uniref:Uncharacterized protein n=1 Tax=candidate division WWE3 bacterium CG_4_10_14_0_2_um_filter_41_14 TaxID=1975072 RepID=A0A2M7TLL5_UNCKA|nr:MAG: hypothetical protein COY32_00865 [candidate division WWE3 bacterium CG_4_10_14_0_2_um_filter_41_14]